jgi:hypothetical protein
MIARSASNPLPAAFEWRGVFGIFFTNSPSRSTTRSFDVSTSDSTIR